jgi:hypothetical protein
VVVAGDRSGARREQAGRPQETRRTSLPSREVNSRVRAFHGTRPGNGCLRSRGSPRPASPIHRYGAPPSWTAPRQQECRVLGARPTRSSSRRCPIRGRPARGGGSITDARQERRGGPSCPWHRPRRNSTSDRRSLRRRCARKSRSRPLPRSKKGVQPIGRPDPLHTSRQEGARACVAGSEGASTRLHRDRAHLARPGPRTRGPRCKDAGRKVCFGRACPDRCG